MIVVFTGNGKGKTTAALGQMVRVAGRDKNALMIQFIKGPWRSGEDEFAERIKNNELRITDTDNGDTTVANFEIRKRGLGFVGILGDQLPIAEHAQAARVALEEFIKEKESNRWQIIVLDEVNVAVSLGLVSVAEVMVAIDKFPVDKIVVLTGRGAPMEFIDKADLVTEMCEVKHPFQDGQWARKLVEF